MWLGHFCKCCKHRKWIFENGSSKTSAMIRFGGVVYYYIVWWTYMRTRPGKYELWLYRGVCIQLGRSINEKEISYWSFYKHIYVCDFLKIMLFFPVNQLCIVGVIYNITLRYWVCNNAKYFEILGKHPKCIYLYLIHMVSLGTRNTITNSNRMWGWTSWQSRDGVEDERGGVDDPQPGSCRCLLLTSLWM